MKAKYFYKAVCVVDGKYRSIYNANPQWYEIGTKIDCPYMFVYAPGNVMGELCKSRMQSDMYALLRVRAESKPRLVYIEDVCWSIHGGCGDSRKIIEEAMHLSPRIGLNPTVLVDSLTPVSVVNYRSLKTDDMDRYLAPSRRKRVKHGQ